MHYAGGCVRKRTFGCVPISAQLTISNASLTIAN